MTVSNRETAAHPRPVRLALVIDHPAQQFARDFQLLAAKPAVRLEVYYWSAAERFYDPGFKRSITWGIDLLGDYPLSAWSLVVIGDGR